MPTVKIIEPDKSKSKTRHLPLRTILLATTCFLFAIEYLTPCSSCQGRDNDDSAAKLQSTKIQTIYSLSQKQSAIAALGAWGLPVLVELDSKKQGTYLSHAPAGSIAAKTGLSVGDVILEINEKKTLSPRQTNDICIEMSGKPVRITIARPISKGSAAFFSPLKVMKISSKWHASAQVLNHRTKEQALKTTDSGAARNKQEISEPRSNHNRDRAGVKQTVDIPSLEEHMFRLVNRDRRDNGGFSQLTRSRQLDAVARAHAEDMARRNYFEHRNPEGKYCRDRVRSKGIQAQVYENLAWGRSSHLNGYEIIELCQADMMSEPPDQFNHRTNILNPQHRCVGIGAAYNAKGEILAVQIFSYDSLP